MKLDEEVAGVAFNYPMVPYSQPMQLQGVESSTGEAFHKHQRSFLGVGN